MRIRLRMSVVMLVAAMAAAALVAIGVSGCGSLAPGGSYQGDKVLYDADVAIATSYEVIHTFVAWEYANREALAPQPGIRAAADRMRRGAPQWVRSALALRDAYAARPDVETRDALATAVGVLRAAMLEATRYLQAAAAAESK